ncbi:MAG: hypothetical protein K8F52_02645 [Candidatus Scalindua rubra]|uniref:AsmA domain-containing protein n=1 Tax=Candidatus Scalindua brodae TaxID=237368 RepID=A0A0B0ED07_9BACT|nr:MAG: hypothetical protein SCABRO_03676 [Candidatus Scalindua brodae]MBZ0107544.1 hypothetical protein [Candidatus Scalindua rubra]TWU34752.1 hypothetical protein S225a_11100 [Candidatus Brocadiaceae bacterium S225]
MKRKVIMIPAIVFAILIALFIGKNMIIKTSVTTGAKAMTGLKLSIRSMNVGVFKSLIGINELQLYNPPGFEDKLMMDLPEIYVDYNLGAIMGGKAHLEEVRLNLKEFIVAKNEAGELNLDSLSVVKETEGEVAEKDDGKKEKTKMPDIQIDLLTLKIDKVIYKDYSKGGSPKVKEFNVNIDERYENITDPQSFVRLIIVKALKNTTIASLANFDIEKLQKGLTEAARKAAEKAMETPDKAVEAGKKAAEETVEKATNAGKDASEKIQETARESVEKATDSIKKFLPFGNKEKK